MQHLPFDPSVLDYPALLIGTEKREPMRTSTQMLTVVGLSGTRYSVILYTYVPLMFDPIPRHLFSRCGRFILMRHKTRIARETVIAHQRVTLTESVHTGQFHVFFRGVPMPEDRYALRTKPRSNAARILAAYKHGTGTEAGVEALRGYSEHFATRHAKRAKAKA